MAGQAQSPADHHRAVAARFSAVVDGVGSHWDDPTPVREWRSRDVVGHLVEWLPALLESGSDVRLPTGPPVDEDPAAAWVAHRDAVQALLDDPTSAERILSNPHFGDVAVPDAIDRFYTADVFLHTWDLARATGQDDTLDPEVCAEMLEGMAPMEDALRGSGQYGPRVDVADGASVQDRLIGFIGRDPYWAPPS